MTRQITRLLVANRGEIASRVFATCRRLGIDTVAVHSDADAGLPYVAEADLAVRLPGDAPADTYLRTDLILDAARRTGADAIHPGYGFLSESAEFARAVLDAGLTWLGPSPEAIESMGDKVRAKELAKQAGVPVLEALDLGGRAASASERVETPLLVKAAAGGGGRGMRVVRDLAELDAEIERAAAEAASAFGDGTVFVEQYVERGRHIEVQVWGDGRGGVHVLGDRDCTVQRRHQKVVEEAPAPDLPDDVREAMHQAAQSLAEAIGYVGVGTVEFIHDPDRQRFAFLEMNTRLQVEHPVTELVTGLDLVELQVQAAEGLPATEAMSPDPRGHAIEVRLYAEDDQWTPQAGRLLTLGIPADARFDRLSRSGVRVDAGFASGTDVSTHYDAMLAKIIAWAPTREQATRQLLKALRAARIHGVTTNRDQLIQILEDEDFRQVRHTTTWLVGRDQRGATTDQIALTAAALMLAADDAGRRTVQQGVPAAWRNVVSQPQRTTFEGHEPVEWWGTRDGLRAEGVTVLDVSPEHARLEVDGVTWTLHGQTRRERPGGPREIWVDGPGLSVQLREVPRFTDPAEAVASGSLLAPMPGTVVTIVAEAGRQVEAGAPVLVLEAMKMQHTVAAPHAGTVTEINVEPGAQVAAGEVLAVVEEEEGQ